MITPFNILRHELIGLHVRILNASNPTYKGLSGVITDETQKTLTILTNEGKTKRIIKDQVVMELTLPSKTKVRVEGKLLKGRPYERVKKKQRIRYL